MVIVSATARRQFCLSSAAKNHLGKVLYGNMYNEIKSGTACNTLVTEYVLRKNPRGDAEIDTEESPFLRDNLRDKLPSLAERTRRRKRRHAASTPPAKGMDPSMPSMYPDAAAAAHDAVATSGDDPDLPDKAGGFGERDLVEDRFDPDCDKATQEVGGGVRPRQARGASGSRSPNGRNWGHRGESEKQGKLLRRRPNYKEPIDRGLAGSSGRNGAAQAHNPNKNQPRSRSGGRAGEIESKRGVDVTDSHRGRLEGRRRQGEPGTSIGERRRRRAEEMTENSSDGDRKVSTSSPRSAAEVGGRRRQQVTTSASLKTLSLQEMEEREDDSRSRGKVDDALDRWVGNG